VTVPSNQSNPKWETPAGADGAWKTRCWRGLAELWTASGTTAAPGRSRVFLRRYHRYPLQTRPLSFSGGRPQPMLPLLAHGRHAVRSDGQPGQRNPSLGQRHSGRGTVAGRRLRFDARHWRRRGGIRFHLGPQGAIPVPARVLVGCPGRRERCHVSGARAPSRLKTFPDCRGLAREGFDTLAAGPRCRT